MKAMKMQSEWISNNKVMRLKNHFEVILLWLEEILLHSTARRRTNDNLQPKLNSYFTYQTPDSAEKLTETRQKRTRM
jgi:hypothetical protein